MLNRAWRVVFTGLCLFLALEISGARALELVDEKLELQCEPVLRYFCENIHIGCAGVTRVRTWPFVLNLKRSTGSMVSGKDRAALVDATLPGVIHRGDGQQTILLKLQTTRGYVALSDSGRFIFRLYVGHQGLMTYGQCQGSGK